MPRPEKVTCECTDCNGWFEVSAEVLKSLLLVSNEWDQFPCPEKGCKGLANVLDLQTLAEAQGAAPDPMTLRKELMERFPW